jgi:LmbE family N-acetylglucosaminyl deacetylase
MTISHQDLTSVNRHIFLSPHYDDIALSAGGTAATLTASGRTPEVALIFGEHPDPNQPMTTFAESLHAAWGMTADEVVTARRREEEVASIALGTCDRFLPFRDAIYRGERYLSNEDIFGEIRADEADLPNQVIAALHLGEDTNTARIYAPLAIGMHVDHQHAYLAGLALATRGWEVWFYEDMPYGLRSENQEKRQAQVEADGLRPGVVVDVGAVWKRKIDAIMAYPSQLKTIFGEYVGVGTTRSEIEAAMASYARSVGGGEHVERFWVRNG